MYSVKCGNLLRRCQC